MSYLGNTPTTQSFISGTDYFNGTGSQTAFTLSRTVASVNDVQVTVNNVVQQPNSGYTISGTTLTFDQAPSAGTNNVYVRYLSTTTQAITPSQNTVSYATWNSDLQSETWAFRNRIINGDMRIDQRNAGASVSNLDGFGVDRWYGSWTGSSTGRVSAQQSSVAPTGFTNSWLLTVTATSTSPATNDGNFVRQRIEGFNTADLGWGTANAQPVTVSFWVRSSVTGTFPLLIANADNTRAFGATFVISSANTWEYKTITVAGDTTGTWVTNNGTGISLVFGLGGGTGRAVSLGWQTTSQTMTTVTGAVNLVATNGATFYITGVQLEKGTTATNFDVRPYGTELALCQRYCEVLSLASGTLAGTGTYIALGVCETSTRVQPYYPFKVQKRAGPSTTLSAIGTFGLRSTGSSVACTSGAFGAPGTAFAQGEFNNGGGGLTAGGAGWLTNHDGNAQIIWSAEL